MNSMIRRFKKSFFALLACVSLIAVLFAVPALADPSGARNLMILPHVESNGDFYTGLSLLNPGDTGLDVSLVAYGDKGRQVGEKVSLSLSSGARFISSVEDIFGYEQARDISWIELLHTGKLSAFGLMGNEDQLTRLKFFTGGSASLILPYVVSGDGLYTKLYLLNAGPDVALVTLNAYDREGNLLKSVELEPPLPSGYKAIGSARSFFGAEASKATSWIEVVSDGELIGIGLVGSIDRLFSLPME